MLQLESLLPLLEAVVSYIDDGVVVADDRGRVLYLNPSACELLAVPPNKAVRRLSDVTCVDLSSVFERSQERHNMCRSPMTSERRIAAPDGYRDLEFECCFTGEGSTRLRLVIIRDITQRRKLEAYLNRARGDLVTNDPRMMEVLQRVEQVAPQSVAVLIQGESGTGKTHIARLIHRMSNRAEQPFVEVNCAAIPDTLIESELFGHVKGAFTGATHDRHGRFRMANGGTLFLDEIGEIPVHLQPKLLRAIQDKQIEPVGSDRPVKVDIRIIAASNRNLREMVDSGEFRADLYYRLAVIPLYIPPVRERRGDIPLLLKHIYFNLESRGYSSSVKLSAEALRLMMDYPWPGNVRELENAVEHAVICAVNKVVRPESLPMDIRLYQQNRQPNAEAAQICAAAGIDAFQGRQLPPPRKEAEPVKRPGSELPDRDEILDVLARAKGNRNLAAKMLGIDRTTLWRRMRRLQIEDSSANANDNGSGNGRSNGNGAGESSSMSA
jgi:PAS domain S-box-containing protein